MGLTVAFENLADMIVLVERDEQVASVWQTIINSDEGAEWLANQIVTFELTAESASQLLSSRSRSLKEKAFKTIVQNRISHGGILAPGAGILKSGEEGKGVLSRWYPHTLSKRIRAIAKIRQRIKFIRGDGFQVIDSSSDSPNVVFFVDPPYTASVKRAGSRLYKYHEVNHEKLFEKMSRVSGDFLMTYDDAEEVRALAVKYRFETRLVAMSNTHHAKMNELLIGRNLSWVDRGA